MKKSLLLCWGDTSSVCPSGGHDETFSSVLATTPCGRLQIARCRTKQRRPHRSPPKPHGRRLLHHPSCVAVAQVTLAVAPRGHRLGCTRCRVAVRAGHSSNTQSAPVRVKLHGRANKSSFLLMGPSSSITRERELAVASCPAPCLGGVQGHPLRLLVLLLEEK